MGGPVSALGASTERGDRHGRVGCALGAPSSLCWAACTPLKRASILKRIHHPGVPGARPTCAAKAQEQRPCKDRVLGAHVLHLGPYVRAPVERASGALPSGAPAEDVQMHTHVQKAWHPARRAAFARIDMQGGNVKTHAWRCVYGLCTRPRHSAHANGAAVGAPGLGRGRLATC